MKMKSQMLLAGMQAGLAIIENPVIQFPHFWLYIQRKEIYTRYLDAYEIPFTIDKLWNQLDCPTTAE